MGDDVSPDDLARRAWETDPHNAYGIEGEDADAYHRRAFGERRRPRRAAGRRPGDARLAVWEPLLTGAERVGPL